MMILTEAQAQGFREAFHRFTVNQANEMCPMPPNFLLSNAEMFKDRIGKLEQATFACSRRCERTVQNVLRLKTAEKTFFDFRHGAVWQSFRDWLAKQKTYTPAVCEAGIMHIDACLRAQLQAFIMVCFDMCSPEDGLMGRLKTTKQLLDYLSPRQFAELLAQAPPDFIVETYDQYAMANQGMHFWFDHYLCAAIRIEDPAFQKHVLMDFLHWGLSSYFPHHFDACLSSLREPEKQCATLQLHIREAFRENGVLARLLMSAVKTRSQLGLEANVLKKLIDFAVEDQSPSYQSILRAQLLAEASACVAGLATLKSAERDALSDHLSTLGVGYAPQKVSSARSSTNTSSSLGSSRSGSKPLRLPGGNSSALATYTESAKSSEPDGPQVLATRESKKDWTLFRQRRHTDGLKIYGSVRRPIHCDAKAEEASELSTDSVGNSVCS